MSDGKERDPGDAVPPGVAVQTPEKLSEAEEKVKAKLEKLGDGKTPG